MYPKIITIAFSIFSYFITYAQAFDQNDRQKTINVTDADGKPFVNPALNIAGTQFFIDDWKYGSIKMLNNFVYNNVSVRLNLQTQEVHFLNPNKTEMAVSPELVKELFIYDKIDGQDTLYDFQCGFPAVEKQTEKDFYLVLSSGKVKLLKSIKKEITQLRDNLSGEEKREFTTYENYFLFADNMLQPVKLKKESILQSMHGHEDKIDAFVKSNKLSYKSPRDLKKIVEYYNLL